MPDYAGTLWVRIAADMSHLQKGLKLSEARVQSFVGRLAVSSAGLKKMGTAVTIVSAAVAALGILAVKTFADFEQSMANTFSVIGANKEEMMALTKTARDMGETTIFTASQAADAMYFLASAGFDANKTMAALKGTLDLAAATQFDLAETTRIVVSTINAFGLAAEDAGRVSNAFSAIISSSQATMDRLADSMKFVAPIANQVGISLEQTTAALGSLFNAGLQASQAGTQLRMGLIRLQKPTDGAKAAIAELGLTMEDINPQANSLVDIISALEKAGAGAVTSGDEMAEIFGTRAAGAFQILVRQGGSALEVMEQKITATNKSAEMAAIQIDTLKGTMKLFKSVVQETAIQIGERLAPLLRSLVDTIRNVFKWFNALPEALKDWLILIPAIGAGLGLIVGPIALLLSMIPKMIVGIASLNGMMSGTLGIVGLVALAITGLVVAIGYFANASERARSETDESIKKMNEYNQSAIDQKEKQSDLIKSYLTLADKSNKTSKEIAKQKRLFETIKAIYPDLISDTDDYITAQDNLSKASDEVTGELAALYKQQLQLRELELTINTARALKEARQLKADMEDTSVGIWKTFTAAFRLMGDSSGVELARTKEQMDKLATTAEGMSRIKSQLTVSTEQLQTAEDDLLRIRANVEKINSFESIGKVGRDQLAALAEQETITKGQVAALETMISTYTGALENGKKLLDIEVGIKENQIELNKLRVEGVEALKKATEDDPDEITPKPVLSAEDEERLAQLLFDLKRNQLQAELQLAKQFKDKSYEQAVEYAKKESELADFELQHEKGQALKAATKLKQETGIVIDTFNKKEQAQEAEHQAKLVKIGEDWDKEHLDIMLRQIKQGKDFNQEELEDFRAMLELKLEDTKAWSDEYVNILNQLKQVQLLLDTPEKNRLLLDVEETGATDLVGDRDEDAYIEALDKYRTFLMGKQELENEFSDEWMNLQREISDASQEIYQTQLDQMRIYADTIISGVTAGFNTMWDQYIIGGTQAANEMDAIWLSIRNAALNAIRQVVEAEITKALLKLLIGIVGTLIGGPVGGAAASYGGGALVEGVEGFAATGAYIRKSGRVNVHAGETIVPAAIVRKDRGFYQGALSGHPESDRPTTTTINRTYNIINPMVDDDQFWGDILEKQIIPQTDELEKRQGA